MLATQGTNSPKEVPNHEAWFWFTGFRVLGVWGFGGLGV